jgi:hypothetical protein
LGGKEMAFLYIFLTTLAGVLFIGELFTFFLLFMEEDNAKI